MNILKLGTAATLTAALFFAGCSKNDSATSVENKEQKVSFSYELSAAFSQRVYNNLPATRAFENVIADMIITDNISGKEDTLDWYLAIDEDPQVVEINSNMTVVLEPSTYTFALTIEKGDHKYIGTSDPKQLDDTNKKIVALNVHPVIGPTNLTFNVTDLPRLKFSYKSDDLKNLANPKIGYVIDEGAEVIVALDKTDGTNSTNDVTVADESGSTVYLNIPEGDHTISLKLYDGDKQVGKSKDAQKTINIAAGMSETMDLIPLHAEATVTIGVDGGEGTINVAVPQEVIDEVGDVANLSAVVTVSGSKNGSAGSQTISNLTAGAGVWNGSVSYESLHYEDNAIITVDFKDIATNELLGNIIFSPVSFNVNGTSLVGDLSLIRRAVISGDILATTGVNVYDAENNPVKGAIITVDGDTVGITGDAWGTDGYLKFHHTKGEVTIKAVDPVSRMEKDTIVTLESLDINNYVLKIGELADLYTFNWSDIPTIDPNDSTTATGIIGGISYTYKSSQPMVYGLHDIQNYSYFPEKYKIPNQKTIRNDLASKNTLTFAEEVENPMLVFASIGRVDKSVTVEFLQNNFDILFQRNITSIEGNVITGKEGDLVVMFKGLYKEIKFNYTDDEECVDFLFGASIRK